MVDFLPGGGTVVLVVVHFAEVAGKQPSHPGPGASVSVTVSVSVSVRVRVRVRVKVRVKVRVRVCDKVRVEPQQVEGGRGGTQFEVGGLCGHRSGKQKG